MRGCPSLLVARESCQHTLSRSRHLRVAWKLVSRFTTSAAIQNTFPTGEKEIISPRHEALTLLHTTSKLVPTLLEQKGLVGPTPDVATWERILSKAYEDFSTSEERPVNITVLGLNEWSGSREFVSALLSNPLSSDDCMSKALKERWKGTDDTIFITHGTVTTTSSPKLIIPSAYLSQFSVPIEISEFRAPISSFSILHDPRILEADIPIILVNPLMTPFHQIPLSQIPVNTILVFTPSTPQSDLDSFVEEQQQVLRQKRCKIRILSADPKRAIQAIGILQSDSTSPSSIQRYQDDVMGSQISSITQAIQDILSANSPTPIRTRLALGKMQDALNTSRNTLRRVRIDLDSAFKGASQLQEKLNELSAKIHGTVFERRKAMLQHHKLPENEVTLAVDEATKKMGRVMDKLTWWKMVSHIDEISDTISAAVTRVWCHDLERKLILEAGRLSAIQQETSKSGLELLSKHPIVQSAVLKNHLLQLESSPSYQLSPESLTKPIHSRRDQIIEYPTSRLHIAAQKAVIAMTTGLLSGVGIGWAGWLGWVGASGEGLFGFLGMDPNTAIGVGALTVVGGIRWGVGKWEKAKKRWWKDWMRVGEGLERDLKATLDRTMDRQVNLIGRTASKGVLEAVKRREEEVAEAKMAIDGLQSKLESISTRASPPKMV